MAAKPKPGVEASKSRPPLKLTKRLTYLTHAGLMFGFMGLFRLLSVDRASELGAFVGRTVLSRLYRPKKAITTIRTAFPDIDDAGVERLLREMYENMGRVAAELAHLEAFAGEGSTSRIKILNLHHIEAALAKGRGVILASGHLGNWEVMPVAARNVGLTGGIVVRPPNNPYIVEWLDRKRTSVGLQAQMPKGAAGVRQIMSALKRNEAVGMLVDQHFAEGIAAPFFGRPAMTTHAPAIFAQKLGTTVLPVSIRRLRGANFEATIGEPLQWPASGNDEADVLAMTSAMNAFLEQHIRLAPAHWLWMHDRWKGSEQLERTPEARAVEPMAPSGR